MKVGGKSVDTSKPYEFISLRKTIEPYLGDLGIIQVRKKVRTSTSSNNE